VHELTRFDGSSFGEFVIKLTPFSPPNDLNANFLSFETLLYKGAFNELCGNYIPYLPSPRGPPISGNADGTFASMECFCFDLVVFSRAFLPLSL
jgi:hypothetical protein